VDDSKGAGATVVKSDDTAPAGSETGPAASGEHLRQLELAGPTTLPTAPDGHYDLGDEHARGGLGRIVRSRDRRLDRTVAIKQLIRGTPINRARFAREARITARLQHPGVVPIYEAGVWPSGQQFYAMRLVEGRPLSAAIDDATSLTERMALLSRVLVVAETMAYAHSRGVIHRDLKPSNVLVGEYGETVVIDWGIAKELGETDAELDAPVAMPALDLTVVGQVMGTPWYMAPEQARGEPTDERSDVYALGAILYHVLAGAPPHAEAAKVVETVAAGTPPPPLAVRAPGVAPDLVAIVDKALAASPQARYPSAAELAADLERYLNGQLVSVHRYGLAALVGRWVARHRAAVAIAALAAVVLVVGGVISVRNIVSARDEARRNASALSAQRDALILTQAESALDRDPTASLAWLKQYPLDGAEWNRVRTIAADAVSRGVARHVLKHGEESMAVAWSADGTRVVASSGDHVTVWNVESGQRERRFPLPAALYVAITDDGSTIAAVTDTDRRIRLWRTGSEPPLLLEGHTAGPAFLSFLPDGRLVSAGNDGSVRTWSASGQPLAHWSAAGDPSSCVAVMRRGDPRIVSIDPSGEVRITDLEGALVTSVGFLRGEPLALAASFDQTLVAAASKDGIWLWSTSGGEGRRLGDSAGTRELRFATDVALLEVGPATSQRVWLVDHQRAVPLAHERPVTMAATSTRGDIATSDIDGGIRLWQRGPGPDEFSSRQLRGHRATVYGIQFSPDGDQLATASNDFDVRIWDLVPSVEERRRVDATDLFQLAYVSSDTVVITSRSGAVYRSNLGSGETSRLGAHGGSSFGLATARNGRLVVTGAWDGSARLWDLENDTSIELRGPGPSVRGVGMAPDGAVVALATDKGLLVGAPGAPLQLLAGHDGIVWNAAFTSDGRTLATTGGDSTIRLWDVPRRQARYVLQGDGAPIRTAFSSDGQLLVTGGAAGGVRLWDTTTGRERLLGTHEGAVRAINISPDGSRVASGGRDRTVRIWDVATGKMDIVGRHDGEVRDVAFSPDGEHLASAGFDQTFRVWNLRSGDSRTVRGGAKFQRVAFRPDGKAVTATCSDGSMHTMPVPVPEPVPAEPENARAWIDARTTAAD
jgi:WD40 repeat protein/tRNA A-37 threonylcarbamoyl transferase component Bud32